MEDKKIKAIVAIDKNNLISVDNSIYWRKFISKNIVKKDKDILKKEIQNSDICVCGKNTYMQMSTLFKKKSVSLISQSAKKEIEGCNLFDCWNIDEKNINYNEILGSKNIEGIVLSVYKSVSEFMETMRLKEKMFNKTYCILVLGGERIYREMLPFCQEFIVCRMPISLEECNIVSKKNIKSFDIEKEIIGNYSIKEEVFDIDGSTLVKQTYSLWE